LPRAEPARVWLRYDEEASACPACASPRLTHLDAFSIPRDAKGRRVSFLTGCHDCGLLFANPLPTPEQLEHFYGGEGRWATMREERTRKLESAHARRIAQGTPVPTHRPRRRDALFDALEPHVAVHAPPPGARALDFGCGDGKFLDRLQAWGWDTCGIEPSAGVAFLRHRRLESPPQDGSFDFVILHHVLEHLTDPLDLLRRLAGATREGGALFVSVPRLDTLPQHGDFRYCINGRTHPICLSEVCLRGLLARAGFATTARLDQRELDEALTDGRPLRLRLVALRTAAPVPLPADPLHSAVDALTRYALARVGLGARVQRALPVRLRAALMDRARAR
jgi:SAM-dependent methyltransferase